MNFFENDGFKVSGVTSINTEKSLLFASFFTAAMFFIDVERVKALADISNLFYISGAGIVGAYMGTTAWMNKK